MRRSQDRSDRADILSLLLDAKDEEGQPLSDQELRDQMITLLIAGHETTATALCWVFYRLLKHTEVLQRLHGELNLDGDTSGLQQIMASEYLDAIIKETLRIHPVVPFVVRYLPEPLAIAGRTFPAGVVLAPCIYLTHRRADLWPEPDRFEPDRFLNKQAQPHEFFPFGGGARRCLGAAFATYEMKVVIAQVLRHAHLELKPGYEAKVVRRSITFAPSKGLPVIQAKPSVA